MPSAEIALPFELRDVDGGPAVESVRTLFQEYQASLGIDLCFQGFAQELAELPGAYAPPAGRLYLALQARRTGRLCGPAPSGAGKPRDEAAVCAAFASSARDRAEYWPSARLRMRAPSAMNASFSTRWRRCTKPRALYAALGFVETTPYAFNPVIGVRFLALELRASERV